MSQLTWEAMNPIDTSRYLDAIQKAQAQSVAGVEQIGNAYKGYYDNLKKQNTNDMLTALNQAQNPEQLAAAQANIAAMQQRWGSGYDMDAVRTAMDERPAVLMERDSKALQYQQEKARYGAIPQINEAAAKFAAGRKGVTPEMAQQLNTLAALGIDASGTINSLATSANSDYTTERNYTTDNYWKRENFNQAAEQFGANLNQRKFEFGETNKLAAVKSAWEMGKDAFNADQVSGAGTTYVAADGTEYTTGGGGGAAMAKYASMFGPLAAGMIRTESSGNTNAVSPKGAQGIIQIMPKTAANPGYGMPAIDLKNSTPEEQVRWGMEYRSRMQKAHGFTEDQATAAYNAGAGRVQQAIKEANTSGGNWLSYMPKETRDYVPRVNKATAQYANGGSGPVGNTPTTAPLVGIDRKVQQKIRGEYQDAMLKYNEGLALKDQPSNVGNVLAGLTAKEKASTWTQDSFDIVSALKDNPQLKGLSAEGITNVYNRAKAWQAKPGTPLVGYNSSSGLKKSIDNIIKDEIGIDTKRKEHIAKASHPSNTYAQKIQQEFEAKGVSISAKEALLHIDPARYEALHGKPTVKVQEALDKKVEGVVATAKPETKPIPNPTATAVAAVDTAAKPKPTPQASTPKAETEVAKPTKQDIVDFYVKRGKVDNVMPGNLFGTPDVKERGKNRELIRQAQKEAAEKLKALEAKEKADKEAKKAKERAEVARVRKEYAERQKQKIANERIKAAASAQAKSVDFNQLLKAAAQQQSLSIANAAHKAKEEEERKRK